MVSSPVRARVPAKLRRILSRPGLATAAGRWEATAGDFRVIKHGGFARLGAKYHAQLQDFEKGAKTDGPD
jgi:hypothetical protein